MHLLAPPQSKVEDGVKFMLYPAGHVLGAAMIALEIDGVRVLYTGDYSMEEDRHLMQAEPPVDTPPNVLIIESTFGLQKHEPREVREAMFIGELFGCHALMSSGERVVCYDCRGCSINSSPRWEGANPRVRAGQSTGTVAYSGYAYPMLALLLMMSGALFVSCCAVWWQRNIGKHIQSSNTYPSSSHPRSLPSPLRFTR